MKRFLKGIQLEIDIIMGQLNSELPIDSKIIAREMGIVELKLQAARSLLEVRLFEDEIEHMKASKEEKASP